MIQEDCCNQAGVAVHSGVRELFYHACYFKFQPIVNRITSTENDIADFISRNHDKSEIEKKFKSKGMDNMKPVEISDVIESHWAVVV